MTVATIGGEKLSIPLELFEAMGRPRVLTLSEWDEQGGRFLRGGGLRDRLRGRFTHGLCDANESVATYSGPAEEIGGEFRIANYHPSYYLMRAVDHTSFWRAIDAYHEHLPISDQDSNALRVSNWLSADVLLPLGRSFLELGCGSGRNLAALRGYDEDLTLAGVEVNEQAAGIVKGATVTIGSLYDLSGVAANSFDVLFTCGVLMHVPHDRVSDVVSEMHRIALRAVVHFELHGPSHGFDFHRYPRDYRALYQGLGIAENRYDVFPHNDFRSQGVAPFHHALLVADFAT
jgi:SAM-dependent methyltransferase